MMIDKINKYPEFYFIIGYLEQLGKFMIDKDGMIVWAWNPKMVKKIIATGVKLK